MSACIAFSTQNVCESQLIMSELLRDEAVACKQYKSSVLQMDRTRVFIKHID